MTLDALNQRIKAETEKAPARFLTEQFGRGWGTQHAILCPQSLEVRTSNARTGCSLCNFGGGYRREVDL